jgi:hypothetical protein
MKSSIRIEAVLSCAHGDAGRPARIADLQVLVSGRDRYAYARQQETAGWFIACHPRIARSRRRYRIIERMSSSQTPRSPG